MELQLNRIRRKTKIKKDKAKDKNRCEQENSTSSHSWNVSGGESYKLKLTPLNVESYKAIYYLLSSHGPETGLPEESHFSRLKQRGDTDQRDRYG